LRMYEECVVRVMETGCVCAHMYIYLHTCMCIYICNMYIFMYIYICMSMYIFVYIHIYMYIYIYMYIFMYLYIYIYIHICTCIHICIWIHTYAYLPIYIYINLCIHTHAGLRMYEECVARVIATGRVCTQGLKCVPCLRSHVETSETALGVIHVYIWKEKRNPWLKFLSCQYSREFACWYARDGPIFFWNIVTIYTHTCIHIYAYMHTYI